MTRFVAAKCPECGASIHIDPLRDEVVCSECETPSAVQRFSYWGKRRPPSTKVAADADAPVIQLRRARSALIIMLVVCLGLPVLCLTPFMGLLISTPDSNATPAPSSAPITFEEACEGGDGRQCYQAGYAYDHGQGRPKNETIAFGYYRKSCNLEYPEGCANLGWAYDQGKGVDRDAERAVELHRRACDLKSSTGCNNLGWAYQRGSGVKVDMSKAVELYEEACDMGSALACNNAGMTAADNPELADDPEKVTVLFELACNRGHGEGCKNLAARYASGTGVAQDADKAKELYKKACSHGVQSACQ